MKVLLVIIGSVSLFLGVLGILLPILPTTPFLLLSASCYLKSSERLHTWLLNHKVLGRYITDYQNRTMPLGNKIVTIILLYIGIGYSVFVVPVAIGKLVLIAIAIGVSIHVARR